MKSIIGSVLLVINIISFVCVLIFGIFGIVEYLLGPAETEKWIKKLNIPLSYNQVLFIGFICLAIMIITYIIRKIFFET